MIMWDYEDYDFFNQILKNAIMTQRLIRSSQFLSREKNISKIVTPKKTECEYNVWLLGCIAIFGQFY